MSRSSAVQAAAVESGVEGVEEAEARRRAKVPVQSKPQIRKHLNELKGDSRGDGRLPEGAFGPERPCPWWHEVDTHAFQPAFIDADRAWNSWLDSLRRLRAGRKVGYPRFKKKSHRDRPTPLTPSSCARVLPSRS
ncbi:hypothetical protein [Streptomyces sp. NPDC097619]|uniref:hypothetical protein n=1 Tax=Streptomyces sp. NPDC097619 TaxID=3157228 RepID=UPI0033245EA3